MNTEEIQIRYSVLAEQDCCLSCGGAIGYAKAQKGEVCVDLGSGRGSDVIKMAGEVGETGLAIGIDVSEGMLNKARKTASKLGVSNTEFIRSELEDLQLTSEKANLVISNCTINHATDKFKTWSEIHRILKKGGRFVVSDIYATKEVPEKYKMDPSAVAECWAGSTTRQDYLNTLAEVGFTDIEIFEEGKPYPKGEIEVVSFTIAGKRKCCD